MDGKQSNVVKSWDAGQLTHYVRNLDLLGQAKAASVSQPTLPQPAAGPLYKYMEKFSNHSERTVVLSCPPLLDSTPPGLTASVVE